MNKPKILIVDDEQIIREMLADHLDEHYETEKAANAKEALALPHLAHFNLVISDINMPGLSGPELLREIKSRHPGIKVVLITAYNVDDYVRCAKEYGVCNIISKTVPFNYTELDAVVHGLITEEIFDIERYMEKDVRVLREYVIRSSSDAKEVRENVLKTLLDYVKNTGELKLVLDEIVTNALYHSPKDEYGNEKYEEFSEITLAENEYIYVKIVLDNEKYGVSIVDNQGNLSKDIVLYKIDRHIKGEGILDDSGRGIFMSRIFADRLIINIAPKRKTEFLILNYRNEKYKGFKPLYINEL